MSAGRAWRVATSAAPTLPPNALFLMRSDCPTGACTAPATAYATCPTAASSSSAARSEEHTSELQSLMRISYAVFCLKKTIQNQHNNTHSATTYTKNTTLL